MEKNELTHWGIPKMKWGVRRYQNEDGTYTEEGKARRRKDDIKITKNNKLNNDKKDSIKSAKTISEEGKKITDSVKNIVRKTGNNSKAKQDLSEMSNQDLQNYITRQNLERQYNELTSKEVNSGKEIVMEILDYAGDTLSVAGSALAIALSIRALKGK